MYHRGFQKLLLFLLIALLMDLWVSRACAENIDPYNEGLKYAYGENIGWINFKPSQGPGVTVSDSALTGYAWSENTGWINLNPADDGVQNNGLGKLSGYAWGQNVGWINFAPAGGGVQIDANGYFFGKAWGENTGWISFNSTGDIPFGVRTSYLSIIPTMTGWGITILTLLTAGLSIWTIMRRRANRLILRG